MTSVENKSAKEQINSKTESKDQQNIRLIQEATQKAFKEFSIDEKTSIAVLINKYTKLSTTMKPGEIFRKLFEIKKNNPNNPKLAQIIINELKKTITRKENELKVLQIKRHGTKLDGGSGGREQQKGNKDEEIQKRLNETKKENRNIKQQAEHLKQLQSSLKPEYQPTQAQIDEKIKTLPDATKAKLQSSGLSEADYAKFLVSKDALFSADDKSQESRDFLDSLKQLNESLGIRDLDQMPNSYTIDQQFFKDNPDLVQHIKDSPDFKELDQSMNLDFLKHLPEVSDFVKKFGDGNLNKLLDQVSPFFDKKGNIKKLNPEEKKLFQTFFDSYKTLRTSFSNTSTSFLKAGAMQAPIVALYQYLDEPSLDLNNLNQQNKKFGDRTDVLTEGTDQVMSFQGNIDGKEINFYFNLTNGKLQCDDHINLNTDQDRISIGENTRTDLNIQLPTQQELITLLKDRFTPELQQDLLKNSSNPQDYLKNLNQLIASTLQESFTIDPLIRSRISMQTEKNLTSQEFSDDFLPPHLAAQLQDERLINNNSQIKKLFQILDHISENSTSDQLMSMRTSFKKLTTLLASPQKINTIADPIVKEQVQNLHKSLQNTATIAERTQTMFSFLQIFIKQDFSNTEFNPHTLPSTDIFNFNDLENFLSVAMGGIKLEQQSGFSPEFTQKITTKRESQQQLAINEDVAHIEAQFALV